MLSCVGLSLSMHKSLWKAPMGLATWIACCPCCPCDRTTSTATRESCVRHRRIADDLGDRCIDRIAFLHSLVRPCFQSHQGRGHGVRSVSRVARPVVELRPGEAGPAVVEINDSGMGHLSCRPDRTQPRKKQSCGQGAGLPRDCGGVDQEMAPVRGMPVETSSRCIRTASREEGPERRRGLRAAFPISESMVKSASCFGAACATVPLNCRMLSLVSSACPAPR